MYVLKKYWRYEHILHIHILFVETFPPHIDNRLCGIPGKA